MHLSEEDTVCQLLLSVLRTALYSNMFRAKDWACPWVQRCTGVVPTAVRFKVGLFPSQKCTDTFLNITHDGFAHD